MRISLMPRVCSGLLCGLLILIAGCGNPSSQNLASLTVTATPTAVSVGGAAVLKAVAHLSDGTTQDVTAGTQWTLSNPALATMSSGAIMAKAAGTLTVQAAYVETTPAGSSPASASVTPQSLSASTQVTITAAGTTNVPAITWNAPAAIAYGTALSATQLNATANVAGTFTYTPAAGTLLKVGTQTLSVLFTPTDMKNDSAATASVQVTVGQASPVITWAAPVPVTVGSALSATQLDATASVPGTFIYSPAAGTVLAAGTQQLNTVFSPTDATDYSSTTAQTSLVVGSPTSGPTPSPTPTPGPAPTPSPTPTPAPTCGGPTVKVNSSMSQSTLQSTISSAPTCALVVFAAGTYNLTSQLNIPCGVSLAGPTVPYSKGDPYTAKITSAVSGEGYPISLYPCTSVASIQYFSCYGGRPSPDGGGCIYIPAGTSNLTITDNYFYGNQGNAGGGNYLGDSMVYFDGSSSATVDSNDTVTWNQFGQSGDCSNLMSNYSYAGLGGNGGFCNGLGVHNGMSNLIIRNNIFSYQEQGMKVYENQGECVNCYIEYNDYNNIHRINFETQANIGGNQPTSMYIRYNSIHDQYDTNFGAWGFSSANGCNAGCVTSTDDNVLINNVQAASAGEYTPGAVEIWGSNGTTSSYNLVQGYWANGLMTSSTGQFVLNNNTFCMSNGGSTTAPGSGGYFNDETSNPQSYTPTATGNTFTNAATCAQTSVTPTISPAGGSFNGSQTVTLTNSGTNRDANTGIWYTTDGSTPVPGSATTTYIASGGTISITATTTLKAVGMWGAFNQPSSYPSGYGYVPSAVVTQSFVSGSAVRKPGAKVSSTVGSAATVVAAGGATAGSGTAGAELTSVAIVPAQTVVAIGSTTQLKAIATFSDGSSRDVTTEFAWNSSDPRTIAATATGSLIGLATGKATIAGSYQGHQALATATSAVGDVDWSGPIVITQGGTYSGNWESKDIKTPAVTVSTSASVIIENSHIQSVGSLIKTAVAGSDLTVRNSVGAAENAGTRGQANGVFLEVQSPARLDVENNYIENAQGGVVVHGFEGKREGEQNIVIRGNRARNINGLLSDGKGGYLPGDNSNGGQARFIQFDSVQSVPGIDVGWNEVINYPGRSLVEDNIDVYRSSGTANQPLEIHDTYIQGAYPYKAAQAAYTGGGIKTDAKAGDGADEVPTFNSIHDNQVVGTVSYGIKFAAGHDNTAFHNRVISSGILADGTRLEAAQVGMAEGDDRTQWQRI
jgi:hypothetical protein